GLGNVAKTGAQSAGRAAASRASAAGQRMAAPFRAGWNGDAGTSAATASEAPAGVAAAQTSEQPAWAKRLQRRQQLTHAATTTAHTLRGGDGGGSGQGPSLRGSDD
ncbi:TPA: P-type conjugative transfer protein TrbL, partial [Enterobacter cloacae]